MDPLSMPAIPDEWDQLPVHQLTTRHIVCILGQELKVVHAEPADRGGDFYLLEALGLHEHDPEWCPPVCLVVTGAVTLEIDKNRRVWAREQ